MCVSICSCVRMSTVSAGEVQETKYHKRPAETYEHDARDHMRVTTHGRLSVFLKATVPCRSLHVYTRCRRHATRTHTRVLTLARLSSWFYISVYFVDKIKTRPFTRYDFRPTLCGSRRVPHTHTHTHTARVLVFGNRGRGVLRNEMFLGCGWATNVWVWHKADTIKRIHVRRELRHRSLSSVVCVYVILHSSRYSGHCRHAQCSSSSSFRLHLRFLLERCSGSRSASCSRRHRSGSGSGGAWLRHPRLHLSLLSRADQ